MKLFTQITLLAAFAASATAQVRNTAITVPEERNLAKSFAFSDSGDPGTAKGEIGCRKECSDKRFTMVCKWEAEKKKDKKSHKKSRRLGEDALDFEDETEDNARALATTQIDVGGGRRLKVSLDAVECILGVGKKDSDDSSEDYEEYKERLKFPDDAWMLKIKSAEDAVVGEFPDYYKFTREVEFKGVEDPSNSADELTIKGELEIELVCGKDDDGKEFLIVDGEDLKFSC